MMTYGQSPVLAGPCQLDHRVWIVMRLAASRVGAAAKHWAVYRRAMGLMHNSQVGGHPAGLMG
jgi:hypothetical protein